MVCPGASGLVVLWEIRDLGDAATPLSFTFLAASQLEVTRKQAQSVPVRDCRHELHHANVCVVSHGWAHDQERGAGVPGKGCACSRSTVGCRRRLAFQTGASSRRGGVVLLFP